MLRVIGVSLNEKQQKALKDEQWLLLLLGRACDVLNIDAKQRRPSLYHIESYTVIGFAPAVEVRLEGVEAREGRDIGNALDELTRLVKARLEELGTPEQTIEIAATNLTNGLERFEIVNGVDGLRVNGG